MLRHLVENLFVLCLFFAHFSLYSLEKKRMEKLECA